MRLNILYCLIIFISFSSFAQESDCACCTTKHSQFDFWVGDWEVFNEKGEKGGTGKSYNYYDPSDATWNQLWISNSGNILKLKGKAELNKMILKSEPVDGKKGRYYNQITWTKNMDGSVTQLWEIYDLDGNLLSNTFKGIYRKKQSD